MTHTKSQFDRSDEIAESMQLQRAAGRAEMKLLLLGEMREALQDGPLPENYDCWKTWKDAIDHCIRRINKHD